MLSRDRHQPAQTVSRTSKQLRRRHDVAVLPQRHLFGSGAAPARSGNPPRRRHAVHRLVVITETAQGLFII